MFSPQFCHQGLIVGRLKGRGIRAALDDPIRVLPPRATDVNTIIGVKGCRTRNKKMQDIALSYYIVGLLGRPIFEVRGLPDGDELILLLIYIISVAVMIGGYRVKNSTMPNAQLI